MWSDGAVIHRRPGVRGGVHHEEAGEEGEAPPHSAQTPTTYSNKRDAGRCPGGAARAHGASLGPRALTKLGYAVPPPSCTLRKTTSSIFSLCVRVVCVEVPRAADL